MPELVPWLFEAFIDRRSSPPQRLMQNLLVDLTRMVDMRDHPEWERITRPEERMLAMKRAHEGRIQLLAEIPDDRASHVLRYAAKIGAQGAPVTYARVAAAMLPDRYPADGHRTIDIELRGDDREDHEET